MSYIEGQPALASGVEDGIEWRVLLSPMKTSANGYARVPEGKQWHGEGYDDIPADVHGGLTFADGHGWIGFDTAHYGDFWDDGAVAEIGGDVSYLGDRLRSSYREDALRAWTLDLLVEETKDLARQVAASPEKGAERIVLRVDHGYAETPVYDDVVGTFGEVLVHTDWGSYQGDSLYLIRKGERYGVLTFGWGSCSGCDALEAVDTQADLDALQDDLERGIRWFSRSQEVVEFLDGGGLKDSYLDEEMVAKFKEEVDKATSIVVHESTVRKVVEP
jgi:hypothetical protein